MHVTKSDPEILEELTEKFDLDPQDVQEVLPPNRRSKMVKREGYVFLILHFPVYNRTTGRMVSHELYFFVTKNTLISISPQGTPALTKIYKEVHDGDWLDEAGKASEFLLWIIHELLNEVFPMLRHVGNDLEEIQDQIFEVKHKHKKNVLEILRIKTNIVLVKRAMQPHKNLVEKFADNLKGTVLGGGVNLEYETQHIREIAVELWQLLASQESTINDLHETNESLINSRTNDIMRTLTIFSVIVFPLTLLASMFGMNTVNTPIVGHAIDFWMIVIVMIVGTIGMIAFFRAKKWI